MYVFTCTYLHEYKLLENVLSLVVQVYWGSSLKCGGSCIVQNWQCCCDLVPTICSWVEKYSVNEKTHLHSTSNLIKWNFVRTFFLLMFVATAAKPWPTCFKIIILSSHPKCCILSYLSHQLCEMFDLFVEWTRMLGRWCCSWIIIKWHAGIESL